MGLTRHDVVVGVGGGMVTDVAGFAAASYHRGMPVVHVATTLLGMVDAAIGGKTGVNLPEGKNLVGAFWQPSGVVCDLDALATLPDREVRCGYGEMAKYHFLTGDDLLAMALTERIARCVEIKAEVVAADEREGGRRAILNYGHTLAHALEIATEHRLAHGEAVAIGLVFAAHLARVLGRIDVARVAEHFEVVGVGYGLGTDVPSGLQADRLARPDAQDKKALDGLTFVLDTDTSGTLAWAVDIHNPTSGEHFTVTLKEVTLPGADGVAVTRPCALALSGTYPRALDGLARLLSLDMRVIDPAWIGMKLRKLLNYAEPLGHFMAFIPGQRRQQTWPSTVAYLARLVIHRYAMLGVFDENGFPLREMGVLASPQQRSEGLAAAAASRPAVPRVRQRQHDRQGRLRFLHRLRLRRAVRMIFSSPPPASTNRLRCCTPAMSASNARWLCSNAWPRMWRNTAPMRRPRRGARCAALLRHRRAAAPRGRGAACAAFAARARRKPRSPTASPPITWR